MRKFSINGENVLLDVAHLRGISKCLLEATQFGKIGPMLTALFITEILHKI